MFWKNIEVRTCSDYYGRLTDICDNKEILCFDNYKSAVKQITNYKNNYLRNFSCLGHVIKTHFSKSDGIYYYIDATTKGLYSNNSEELCELITVWEEDKKKKTKVTIHEYVED